MKTVFKRLIAVMIVASVALSCAGLTLSCGGSLKLEEISVASGSVQTEAKIGETLDFAGIRVTARYNDKTSKTLSFADIVLTFEGNTLSEKDETVTQFFATLLCFPENFTPLMQAALDVVRPNFFLLSHQYEFNRLNLTYVVVSKRKLIQLVQEKYVDGWDDPRMPTIVGLRRRGFTPKSLQNFAERCGVSKVSGGWIDYSVLEQCLREDLEERAERRVAVLRPLKLIIDNYPEGQTEELEANNHPQKPEMGTRRISFSRELWIEEGDFAEVPPKGFRRLTVPADGTPAKPVRLRYGYVIVPTSFEKDESGRVTAVHAEYLPETRSGSEGSMSVKTKATIHWLDAKTAVPAEIRVYDRLFNVPHPDEGEGSFLDRLTPDSKTVLSSYVEPAAAAAARDDKFQFERNGYFVADREDHTAEKPVFNLAVGLKDSWGK